MTLFLYSISLFLLFMYNLYTIAASGACPPSGAVLPFLRHPSQNTRVRSASADLVDSFEHQFTAYYTTFISIGVESIHDHGRLLDVHHTPSIFNVLGTARADSDTVYRVGSISKVFTVLTVLLQHEKIGLDAPVTDYLPELLQLATSCEDKSTDIKAIRWTEVTIGALASQLAGIPRESIALSVSDDMANLPFPWTSVGLPPLTKSEQPNCGIFSPCTRKDFFRDFGKRHPIYAPYTTPVYSNVAFAILAFVVEEVTNKTFEDYLHEAILDPLDLTRTSLSKPANDSWGAIPLSTFGWNVDLGFENPGGNIYSSTNDLLAFGRSILENKLLEPYQTRAWLKPRSHTVLIDQAVGLPWEIFRGQNIIHDGRVIDFYTKGGTLDEYHSLLVLVPDYGLVFTILTAGPGATGQFVAGLATEITETMLPAFEKATKFQALHNYAGSYQSATANGNVTVELSVDESSGLLVNKLTSNGTDMIYAWASLRSSPNKPGNHSLRLFPTNLVDGSRVSWRAVLHFAPVKDPPRLFYPQDECVTWLRMDGEVYGYNALDDFVFTHDDNGAAMSVESRALRQTMVRSGEGSMRVQ